MGGILMSLLLVEPHADSYLAFADINPADKGGSRALGLLQHAEVKAQTMLLGPLQQEGLVVRRLLP